MAPAVMERPTQQSSLYIVDMKREKAIYRRSNETANYTQGTFTSGYGQASGVYVEVTKGAWVEIDVDFTINTLSEDTFKKWKTETSSYFTQEQKNQLEENHGAAGSIGGFFMGCFGLLFGGGDINHYKNTQDDFKTTEGSHSEGFLKTVYNLETQAYHVHGKISAQGISNIPSKASVFVQVAKVKFIDGKKLSVISIDDFVAAQSNGTVIPSKDKQINITPLSD